MKKKIDLTEKENTYKCNGCGKTFTISELIFEKMSSKLNIVYTFSEFEAKKKLNMPECPYCGNLIFFGMEKLTNHS